MPIILQLHLFTGYSYTYINIIVQQMNFLKEYINILKAKENLRFEEPHLIQFLPQI